MINNLQNTIKTQYGRETATAQANYCGPSTLEKIKIKQTGREKLKLDCEQQEMGRARLRHLLHLRNTDLKVRGFSQS